MKQLKSLFGAYIVLIGSSALASGPAVMPMPDSWERTLGFLDWSAPDMTEDEIRANADNYSFVWSGQIWQPDFFRTTNPNLNYSRYTPAFFDHQNARPDAYEEDPEEDTFERRARTLLWWNTEVDGTGHPDWVLYQCDRQTPAYYLWWGTDTTNSNMPLDFTNPDVIEWQVRNSSPTEEPGFTALSADLLHLYNFSHACGVYRNGRWVQLFSGEEPDLQFVSAVISWARETRERLHSLPLPRGLVANFPLESYYSDSEVAAIASSLDGVLDEQGFTGYAFGRIFVSGEAWLSKVRQMTSIQEAGGAYYSVNYVTSYPPSPDDVDWILGSFLMGREHSAYLLTTLYAAPLGGVRWPHLSQYDEDMGHPCGPMRSTENVYVRDYSKGMAVVNPSWGSSYTFTMPEGSFNDLYGDPIEEDSLTLEPLTGRVLLSSGDRCP